MNVMIFGEIIYSLLVKKSTICGTQMNSCPNHGKELLKEQTRKPSVSEDYHENNPNQIRTE
ncbi:hypothetical protein I79_010828 [Cricetulus griseus]|uniref:Uncharacterized protein n=1 Tax=Cricetulus griseus TaxID=10029 RepID=G3HJI4_CRIGR|nr:hypothetical protein I79_010828 [Cricetulus griseus]